MQEYKIRVFSLMWLATMQIYWMEKSIFTRKDFKSNRIGFEYQHGQGFFFCLFFFLWHQYCYCDIMWEYSIIMNILLWYRHWALLLLCPYQRGLTVWNYYALFSIASVVWWFMVEQCFLAVERNIQIWVQGAHLRYIIYIHEHYNQLLCYF